MGDARSPMRWRRWRAASPMPTGARSPRSPSRRARPSSAPPPCGRRGAGRLRMPSTLRRTPSSWFARCAIWPVGAEHRAGSVRSV